MLKIPSFFSWLSLSSDQSTIQEPSGSLPRITSLEQKHSYQPRNYQDLRSSVPRTKVRDHKHVLLSQIDTLVFLINGVCGHVYVINRQLFSKKGIYGPSETSMPSQD